MTVEDGMSCAWCPPTKRHLRMEQVHSLPLSLCPHHAAMARTMLSAQYECDDDNHSIGCRCPGVPTEPSRAELASRAGIWVVWCRSDGLRVETVYLDELSALRHVNDDGTYSLRATRISPGDLIQETFK